jgi:hypothetical protein
MRPILNRLSPSHWVRGSPRRRMGQNACVGVRSGRLPWHARWAQQIVGRFRRRGSGTGMHPEAMIMAFAARPWNFYLQNFMANTWVAGGNGALMANQRTFFPSADLELRPQGIREPQSLVRNYFSTQVFREFARDARFMRGQVSSVVFSRSDARGNGKAASESAREETEFTRARMAGCDSLAAMPLTRFFLRRAPSVVTAARRSVQESTGGAQELVANITQKHRRIEERRSVMSREPMSLLAPPPAPAIADGSERRQTLSRRGLTFEAEIDGRSTPQRQEFPFNVARVTDEILKQLDRRVIAVRERMGRI